MHLTPSMTTKLSKVRGWTPAAALALTVYFVLPGDAYACPNCFQTLHSFAGGANDGSQPGGGTLAEDSAGNMYGTTYSGGAFNNGTIYKITPGGTFSVLYSFASAPAANPSAGVVRDSAGNLYGTTNQAAAPRNGVVYKYTAGGQFSVLYAFTSPGTGPENGVMLDSAGNLYGAAYVGPGSEGVYKIDSLGNYSVLYTMATGQASNIYGTLLLDSAGNLYGAGASGGFYGGGQVFKLDPSGNYTDLWDVGGYPSTNIGGAPSGTLVRSGANLYLTVFDSLSQILQLGYNWMTPIYTFSGGSDGAYPETGVILDSSGNIYGTTGAGGGAAGAGVAFKLDAFGHFTVLHTFTDGLDGAQPNSSLVHIGSYLYGTTYRGGAIGYGVVFRVRDH